MSTGRRFVENLAYSGLSAATNGLAFLLILYAAHTLTTEAMQDWGWRIPFLVAGPLGGIGLYLRMKMEDTPGLDRKSVV